MHTDTLASGDVFLGPLLDMLHLISPISYLVGLTAVALIASKKEPILLFLLDMLSLFPRESIALIVES